jgi:two-component sensor histidine kinase
MDPQPIPYLERRWVRWSLYIGFWTMLAMINVGQNYYKNWIRGNPFDLWKAMLLGVSDWYMWAALAPLVYQLARRYPLDQRRWSMSLPLHVIVSIIVTAEVVAFTIPFFWYCGDPDDQRRSARSLFLIHFTWGFVTYSFVYWGIVGISHTVDYYQKYRERERKAAQLEIQLAQAQLQVLKMQLHPHFLFNTLNAISALMHKDVELADTMVARLGELLRSSLETIGTQEVPLRKELEFIQPYLEIEQARLGERLSVKMDIEPEAMDLQVPNMILQPLVENAIRHGIAPFSKRGQMEITARREDGKLRLQVRDNGPGLSSDQQHAFKPGVGIANTRARLQQLYGADHRFEMNNGISGGLLVTILIPAREFQNEELRNGQQDTPSAEFSQEKSI